MDKVTRSNWTFTIVENSILDSNLSPWAKLVYVMLCRYADREGLCFPGIKTIAEKCGCSENTVRTSLKELQKWGALTIERRREGRTYKSNLYMLHAPQTPDEIGGVLQQVKGGTSPGEGELYPFNYNNDHKETPEEPETNPLPPHKNDPVPGLVQAEAAYFEAWAGLYRAGKVQTETPIYDYPKNRKLLKRRLSQVPIERLKIIIDAATRDEWIVDKGFSLSLILSDSIINRLAKRVTSGMKEGIGSEFHDDLADEILATRRSQECKG
jgi:biotin operon repressor